MTAVDDFVALTNKAAAGKFPGSIGVYPAVYAGSVAVDSPSGAKVVKEAHKRGADEELIIMGEVKLEFWTKARERRAAADKALKDLTKPIKDDYKKMIKVVVPDLEAALAEGAAAKVEEETMSTARMKLEIARSAQLLHAAQLPEADAIDIPWLQKELDSVGGFSLAQDFCRGALGRVRRCHPNAAVVGD